MCHANAIEVSYSLELEPLIKLKSTSLDKAYKTIKTQVSGGIQDPGCYCCTRQRETLANSEKAFEKAGDGPDAKMYLTGMYAKIGQLEMERDFLRNLKNSSR